MLELFIIEKKKKNKQIIFTYNKKIRVKSTELEYIWKYIVMNLECFVFSITNYKYI